MRTKPSPRFWNISSVGESGGLISHVSMVRVHDIPFAKAETNLAFRRYLSMGCSPMVMHLVWGQGTVSSNLVTPICMKGKRLN